jgi:hypothetical protein
MPMPDDDQPVDEELTTELMVRERKSPPTLQAIVDAVRKGILTQMDGRDLARVVETERVGGNNVQVYTVSQEQGGRYRSDRHYAGDFNHRKFVRALKHQFSGGGICFDQVVLDYFWIPSGWDRQHWSRSFFQTTLISLAEQQLLGPEAKVYLPFCLHVFKEVLIGRNELLQHYNVSFLRKNALKEIALWRGTQAIDPRTMQWELGKRSDQVSNHCVSVCIPLSE